MGLYHCCSGIRAIPRPLEAVRWDPMEVARFAMIAFVLDEEPDFALERMIDLFGRVHVRLCVIARRSQRDQKAALVTVGLTNDHRAVALAGLEHDLFLRN